MTKEAVIRNLRGMLSNPELPQDEHDTICAAIRLLGGNP